MPVADLGFVHDDDVGQLRREQVMRAAPAGDALTITTVPDSRAIRAASMAVAIGISSCSRTSLSEMTALASPESTVSRALAPGATTMMFSPAESTAIDGRSAGTGHLDAALQPDRWPGDGHAAGRLRNVIERGDQLHPAPARAAATA